MIQITCLTIVPLHDAAFNRLFFLLLQSIHLRACILNKLSHSVSLLSVFILKTNKNHHFKCVMVLCDMSKNGTSSTNSMQ